MIFGIFFLAVSGYCGVKSYADFKRRRWAMAAWGSMGVVAPLLMYGWFLLLVLPIRGV